MQRWPLWMYVVVVIAVWIAAIVFVGFIDPSRGSTYVLVGGGFLLGMLAMYIAMHIYRW